MDKKTRDASFVDKDANGHTVNRCEGISFIGGCTDTNGFNYIGSESNEESGLCCLENQEHGYDTAPRSEV